MDSFPYESWEEAVAAADGAEGYYTFGPGGNAAIVIITLLAILLAVWWLVQITMREAAHLDEKARQLNEKWGI